MTYDLNTLQGIFDKVVHHLRTQKAQSVDSQNGTPYHSGCMYHSPTGLKCAAGCLISDEFYNKELETFSVFNIGVTRALKNSGIDVRVGGVLILLRELQSIHDSAEYYEQKMNKIEWKFQDVANRFCLKYTDPVL